MSSKLQRITYRLEARRAAGPSRYGDNLTNAEWCEYHAAWLCTQGRDAEAVERGGYVWVNAAEVVRQTP